ncbi:MAG: hypothetical protein AMXMBFR47_31390 [Planctomycetota bacterium]
MVGVSIFLIYLILGLFVAFIVLIITMVATSGFKPPVCDRCGVRLRFAARFCARCGKPVQV